MILGCSLIAAVVMAACGSGASANVSTGPGLSTTSTGASDVGGFARQYAALADEMNNRMAPIQAQGAQLSGPDIDVAAAKSLMTQQATIIRAFDTRVVKLAIPDRVRPDVQAVVDADEQIAHGLDQMVASAGCAQSCSAYARMAPYFAKRNAALVRLRAELGLPAPRQPSVGGTPVGAST